MSEIRKLINIINENSSLSSATSKNSELTGSTNKPSVSKDKTLYKHYLSEISLGEIELDDVPEEFLTPELCLTAVKKFEENIYYVPNEIKTQEMVNIAAKFLGINDEKFISTTPSKFFNESFYLADVSGYGKDLEFVPDKFKTEEVCVAAVLNDKEAMQFVPERHRFMVSLKAL